MSINNGARIDRRVQRTRRNLRQALFELCLEKGYDAVTVEEITQRADLGRTTFYLHYHDKEDLLMESVRELVDGLILQLEQVPLEQWAVGEKEFSDQYIPITAIALAFQHVAENASLYRLLLRGEGTYSAFQRMQEIVIRAIANLMENLAQRQGMLLKPQVPLDVMLHSMAGAWIGLVSWWLEQDMPYSAKELALMYHRMYVRGTRDILGLTPK